MERKEPTFSGNSSLSSEPPIAPNRPQPQKKVTKKVTPPPVSGLPASVSKGSSAATVALLLALVALGIAGYSSWMLLQTQQQLSDASSRILELQQALVLTGDESTQSMAGLQANLRKQQGDLAALRKDLKTSEHEIRKLWDTRNVNKKAIAANKTSTSSNTKAIAQQQSKTKSLPGDIKSLKSQLDGQAKQLSSINTDARQALETATLLSGSIEQQQQTLRELVDADAQVENSLRVVKKTAENNAEAIRSIDAFRKNTNSELWKLKQQLQPRTTTAQ